MSSGHTSGEFVGTLEFPFLQFGRYSNSLKQLSIHNSYVRTTIYQACHRYSTQQHSNTLWVTTIILDSDIVDHPII